MTTTSKPKQPSRRKRKRSDDTGQAESNVIAFPKNSVRDQSWIEPIDPANVEDIVFKSRKLLIDASIDEIMEYFFIVLNNGNLISPNNLISIDKDVALIIESMRSCIYKLHGREHTLQAVSEKINIGS